MSEFPGTSPGVAECVAAGRGHVHLIGVCGVGMAGLAWLLKARGFTVSGCDRERNRLAEWLEARGIAVRAGHDPEHVAGDVAWVVRTAAVPADAPEPRRAAERGLSVWPRGAVLPALLPGRFSIAVGGTHGKTTTSGFIAQMLARAGRDPSWCIGGEVEPLDGVAGVGRGDALVVEADESDGTLALYRPDVAVITNIERDHLEHFAGEAELEACFRRFAAGAARRIVYCADDPWAAAVCGGLARALGYGCGADARLRATDIRAAGDGQRFAVEADGRRLGELALAVPGRHNVLNALAAAAAGLEAGLTFEQVRAALAEARLPRRRFERVAERAGVTVISDYAHHPSEIAALLRTARALPRRRLLAVFQPHRYTRTLALGPEFPAAFAGADELVLTPVYAAAEAPLPGGTVWDLYRHFRPAAAEPPGAAAPVSVATSLRQAWEYYRGRLAAGDVLLVIGAGDVEQIAFWARAELERGGGAAPPRPVPPALSAASTLRADEPLAEKTTLRVGGRADWWAEAGSEADLVALLRWAGGAGIGLRVLGAGSNTLVSDLGVRGVVARLTGPAFGGLREEQGLVVAGAGAPLRRLLDFAEERGWAGLEFLEGIPGSVGGAARMNAGAWGSAIAERVEWIRYLNADGTAGIVRAAEMAAGYRRCGALEGRAALEVALRLTRGERAAIRRARAERAAWRRWMQGLRSAGSVFKNPPGDYAGRLLEAAGLKGARIGGARIWERHANVIVTEPGARASDVRALLERARAAVRERFGVALETEIEVFE